MTEQPRSPRARIRPSFGFAFDAERACGSPASSATARSEPTATERVLEDADPAHVEWVEQAYLAGAQAGQGTRRSRRLPCHGLRCCYCSSTSKTRFFGDGPNDAQVSSPVCSTPGFVQSQTPPPKTCCSFVHWAGVNVTL